MNVVVINVVVSVLMLAVDFCHGETSANLTCDRLPRVDVPSAEEFTANSPYLFDYVLSSIMDCSTEVFTYPARGATNYNGSAMLVNGDNVIAYDYVVGSDGKTLYATICGTDATTVWYASAKEFNANGAFFCFYSCNGSAIAEYACSSNNNRTSPKEIQDMKLAMSVPNGNLIHDAQQNCSARHGCHAF